jgi:predicted acetyltransferase
VAALVRPEAVSLSSFADAMEESLRLDEGLPDWILPAFFASEEGFTALCSLSRANEVEAFVAPHGLVPQTTLFWAEGDEFVGRFEIRHRLTDALYEQGGHIGYYVRPSARGQGHATAMLAAGLPMAAEMGINPALVTCDDTNVASRRVIEANGGVPIAPSGAKLRYWVPTAS